MSIFPITANGVGARAASRTDMTPLPVASGEEADIPIEGVRTPEEAQPETMIQADVAGDGTNKVKGVVRNLMDGHFKGVADVRLRINFWDDIAALTAERTAGVARDGVSDLTQSVSNEVGSFLQSADLEEATAATITQALQDFNSNASQAVNTDDLRSHLQSGFDAFLESMTAALNMSTQPEAEGVDEPADDLGVQQNATIVVAVSISESDIPVDDTLKLSHEQFIADLTATFEAKLNQLFETLATINVLPDLSEPEGNGKAFQKFLAVYNELQDVDTEDSPASSVDLKS